VEQNGMVTPFLQVSFSDKVQKAQLWQSDKTLGEYID